jgi:3-oxoacyl-[acyl-carrier-protein] synthase-1
MPVGIELAEVIRLATGGGSSPAGPGFVLNSLNGDRWMSWEWGHAVPRLDAGVAAWPQWQPAESFGEIGAATMAAMICMAVAGYERGYARGAHALLCGIGNDGGRAAALVSRAS